METWRLFLQMAHILSSKVLQLQLILLTFIAFRGNPLAFYGMLN